MDDRYRAELAYRLARPFLIGGLVVLSACLWLTTPLHAQVRPPSEQETQAPPESPEAPLPPPPKPVSVDLGWSWWNVDGNLAKFRQYATPPNSRFLRELRYISPFWRTATNCACRYRAPQRTITDRKGTSHLPSVQPASKRGQPATGLSHRCPKRYPSVNVV